MAETAAEAAPRARRTQTERRAKTNARLLDATLDCLIERGYSGTTTTEVENRAGVSRGARLHYYPTKARLLSAAVAHLYTRIAERYAAAMEEVDPDGDRFHEGYRLLWDTYKDPAFAAVLELLLAARTDDELRAALKETSGGHQKAVRRRANTYFPDLAHRDADGLLESLQAMMTGLALQGLVFGDDGRRPLALDVVERMVNQTFAPQAGGTFAPQAGAAATGKKAKG